MGCSGSSSAAAAAEPAPGGGGQPAGASDPDALDRSKQLTKEAFEAGVRKLLGVAIDGYPRALRSVLARRNEMLRSQNGDQDQAAEGVKDQAGDLKEEGKNWLIGLVPYVGLPASLLYPAWKQLRRVCLLAAVFGHNLQAEETRAKVLQTVAGLKAVPCAENAVEMALSAVWRRLAGPIVRIVPVGTLVTSLLNVEGAVVDMVGRESFGAEAEGRRPVPETEYSQELDPEPTHADYLALAQEGAAAVLFATWEASRQAANNPSAAMGKAKDVTANAAGKISALGQGATALAVEKGQQGLNLGMETGQDLLNKGLAKGQQAAGLGSQPESKSNQA